MYASLKVFANPFVPQVREQLRAEMRELKANYHNATTNHLSSIPHATFTSTKTLPTQSIEDGLVSAKHA